MKKLILMLFFVTGIASFAQAQDSVKVKKAGAPADPATKEAHNLQKKLKLTDDQTKQITAIIADRNAKVEDLKGVPNNANRGQIDQVRTDANNQIEVLLTPDQRTQYVEMITAQKSRTNDTKFLIPTTNKKKGF